MHNCSYQITLNARQDLCISGRIDLNNAAQASIIAKDMLASLNDVRIDLSGIEYADSSSLAMLIECIRSAKKQQKDIILCNMPQFMLDLGRVCGLDSILPTTKPLHFKN